MKFQCLKWVFKLFPNARIPIIPKKSQVAAMNPAPRNNFGDWLEKILKKFQLRLINKHKTTELITDTQLWFHPEDFGEKMLLLYKGLKVEEDNSEKWADNAKRSKIMFEEACVKVRYVDVELLEISNKFVWVMDVFDKLEEANACCDHLGLGVVGLIEEIKASKDTMGKSKHGQRAREALENVLNSNDEIRVLRASRWYEKHEQEKKAREAVKPEDPAIGVAGQNKKKQQVSTGATPKAATGTNPPTG